MDAKPTRSALLAFALCAAALTAGCPPGAGALDDSGLPVAQYDEVYAGQLSVVREMADGSLDAYTGPASFAISAGDLPPGLALDEAGAVTGTPTWIGFFTTEVWVSGLSGIPSFVAEMTIEVSGSNANAFLGHERDQLTQLYFDQGGRQADMWVRAAGGGGPDMNSYTVNVGVYAPGPNGVEEEGLNDDVRIGDVIRSEIEVSVGPWEEVDEVDPNPGAGYPSGHYSEGSPATYDGEWTFTAGSDTGEMEVTFEHPSYGRDRTRLMVVPPDWCTQGHQIGNYWDDPTAACE